MQHGLEIQPKQQIGKKSWRNKDLAKYIDVIPANIKKKLINSLKKPQMSEQAAVKMKKMSYVIKIKLKD